MTACSTLGSAYRSSSQYPSPRRQQPPPKHPAASVIGFLKGKSAIAIARLSVKERNFSAEHFWARG